MERGWPEEAACQEAAVAPCITEEPIDPQASIGDLVERFGVDGVTGNPRVCDLVLEGGVTHGMALMGAVEALREAGYTIHRIAGTSIGALVGAAIASKRWNDVRAAALDGRLRHLLLDRTWPRGRNDPGQRPGGGGLLSGDALQGWIDALFSDVPEPEPDAWSPELYRERAPEATWATQLMPGSTPTTPVASRFRLNVVTADPQRRTRVVLPRDLGPAYNESPDAALVAPAIYASLAIPLVLEGARLPRRGPRGVRMRRHVDGGLVTNFPVDLFDRPSGLPPRFPTFGLRLGARRHPKGRDPAGGPLADLVITALQGRNRETSERIDVVDRTVDVPVFGLSINVLRTRVANERLEKWGRHAMEIFLGRRVPAATNGHDAPPQRDVHLIDRFAFAPHQDRRCRVVYGMPDGQDCPVSGTGQDGREHARLHAEARSLTPAR